MLTFWLLFPAGFGALILAAHFLRRGQVLPTLVCLGLVVLLFVRRPLARRALRVALVLGALEWMRTLVFFVAERRVGGTPWIRLAVILGIVCALTLGSALLLSTARARRHFGGASDPGPPPDPSPDVPRLE